MFAKLTQWLRGNNAKEAASEKTHCVLMAPMTGTMVPLKQVPDATFSQKLVGDGCALLPTAPEVLAPADGRITKLFKTRHALTLELPNGLVCLIHCGINTVELNGEGFEAHVEVGESVSRGQKLLTWDLGFVGPRVKSLISPVLITNPERLSKQAPCLSDGDVAQAGLTPLLNLTLHSESS